MNIVVINGTQVKGCTYNMKNTFIKELGQGHNIREFYLPKDMPHFCQGCKTCFFDDENKCPHAEYVMPIWNALLEAQLIVFAYPVYGLRCPGQVKALLDHFCCHWIVHRPEEVMFEKHAVIITNSIGASNKGAQKDVKTSLNWMGVSSVKCIGAGLMEGVIWNELSDKRRTLIESKLIKAAKRYRKISVSQKKAKKNIKTKMIFGFSRMIHKGTLKGSQVISRDDQHWLDKGWIQNNNI